MKEGLVHEDQIKYNQLLNSLRLVRHVYHEAILFGFGEEREEGGEGRVERMSGVDKGDEGGGGTGWRGDEGRVEDGGEEGGGGRGEGERGGGERRG